MEEFHEGSYDLRVQLIGENIRVFKRQSVGGNWKTNTGSSHLEEIKVQKIHRDWAKLASTLFGGLDILTVDAIHDSQVCFFHICSCLQV